MKFEGDLVAVTLIWRLENEPIQLIRSLKIVDLSGLGPKDF